MALAYLHLPISEAETIRQLVDNHEIESMHLDFKGFFWDKNTKEGRDPRQEAAKDVAAFANSEGGTIIVGIHDAGERASGWNSDFKHERRRQQLEDWLRKYLSPADVVSHLEIYEITLGGGQEVLVINIPPWPYGVIGVLGQDGYWLFPFRLGRHTKFLSLDEAMDRNHAGHRVLSLKIKRLMEVIPPHEELGGPPIRFASPLLIQAEWSSRLFEEPVPLFKGGHGALIRLEDDGVLVAMNKYGGNYYSGESRFNFEGLPPANQASFHAVAAHGAQISIPFDLIFAAWRGAEEPSAMHLVIRGTVYWHRDHWALRTSDR